MLNCKFWIRDLVLFMVVAFVVGLIAGEMLFERAKPERDNRVIPNSIVSYDVVPDGLILYSEDGYDYMFNLKEN